MADADIIFVRLRKGATFRTPWGLTLRKGKPLRLSAESPHIPYFRSSNRFEVKETISTPRVKKGRTKGRRRAPAKIAKKTEGPPQLSRKQLVAAAKELGLNVRSSDNADVIQKMIDGVKPMLAEKAAKDAAAAKASESANESDDKADATDQE